ncbi:MAG: saccharopine dehydrogenase C-terminal domain-containing protein, partial [Thermovirgaceae bacterium]|nr:saccharopine dehydrogenase C-terminal domain-containing protein [Thermovirgaceae bacterium]
CEKVEAVLLDASNKGAMARLMQRADVVMDLLPGVFAFPTASLASELGVSLVTSMYLMNPGEQDPAKRKERSEDLEKIDKIARSKGTTILEEFGMDPGVDLVLGRRTLDQLDEVIAFHSYGAGFPEKEAANNPLSYKFTWSIIGVMKSYLRPAMFLEEGKLVEVPADEMFSPKYTHILDLPEMGGPLECFPNGNTAAFAKLFGIEKTVLNMGRYICRWPGHGAFWNIMAKSGFLDETPIECGGVSISPAAFCSSLLSSQEQFFYKDNERDIALIRTDARGSRNGKPTRVINQIIDRRDLKTGFTSMQRTVGFPVSIGAQMILDGRLDKKGIVSPMEVPFEPYMEELSNRGIHLTTHIEEWDGRLDP